MDKRQRPLSPHLQVYKPQLTSILSIMHRTAGVFLTTALVALSLWLIALGSNKGCFDALTSFFDTTLGQALFGGWIIAFFYHFANGIRHLIWDAGKGFDLSSVYLGGWIVLAFTAIASALVFMIFA